MTRHIVLTRGLVALVDDEDYESVSRHKWCALKGRRTNYAVRTNWNPVLTVYMHATIAGTPPGFHTDHLNGDGLDNRRQNLRVATAQQNAHNHTKKRRGCTSRYRGVCWDARKEKWLVTIRCGGKGTFVGYFDDETEAALAYDAAGLARDPKHFTPNFGAHAQQGG